MPIPSWRSSGNSRCGLGKLIPARTKFAGARVSVTIRWTRGRDEKRGPRVFRRRHGASYRRPGSAVIIWTVGEDGDGSGVRHHSTELLPSSRLKTTTPPRAVLGPGVGGLVGWARPGGLRLGKFFTFFLIHFLFLFLLSS
jgi:hypothetical protein